MLVCGEYCSADLLLLASLSLADIAIRVTHPPSFTLGLWEPEFREVGGVRGGMFSYLKLPVPWYVTGRRQFVVVASANLYVVQSTHSRLSLPRSIIEVQLGRPSCSHGLNMLQLLA